MNYILFPHENHASEVLGGKAQALASLQTANVAIPAWFVLSPAAFWDSLSATEKEALTFATTAEEMQQAVVNLCPNESVCAAITQALTSISPNKNGFAVRSSAIDEDGASHSFAGQLDSFLFVPETEIANQVAEVWRSAFSARIFAYRCENNLQCSPQPPAVLIQRMVNAEAAGVAFGADPITGARAVTIISAVRGTAEKLVSGATDGDTYHINRTGEIIARQINDAAILTDEQIRQIASLAKTCNQHFNRPQDIEWALENGQLFLLQARPITTLKNVADPDGALYLWDNSNIAESYGGVITPLTFSFARLAYEEVYRQFCRLMFVPKATIKQHDQTFKNMLGLLRGRVYYNLLNWYRVLAMLPGFKINRPFMEQMMGVKEGLPELLLAEFAHVSKKEKLRDSLNLLATMGGLGANYFLLPRKIKLFYARLNDALQETDPPLAEMRADELAAYYRHIESQLLTRWDAPLINDFFAMIFYGVLRRWCEQWCHDGSLQNNLLCGEGGIISAEPAKRIKAMAENIADKPDLIAVLCNGSLSEINHYVATTSNLKPQISAYLVRFGDRCLDELKLESETLNDNPLLLYRSIGNLAALGAHASRVLAASAAMPLRLTEELVSEETHGAARIVGGVPKGSASLRTTAEHAIKAALTGHPLRRVIFHWVLRQTRIRVRERENLRFERTRLFGRARRLFVELGKRFYADDLLNNPRDIFYLEVEEILGFISGTTTTTDLKSLITIRQTEFVRHQQANAPPDRSVTRGTVHQGNQLQPIKSEVIATIGNTRSGLACCPGFVRGKARVVTDPCKAQLQHGEILVAARTDPGWIMLFPAAAGLLVERGSLLSHSAIVAREMGLPAIVSLAGITQWLADGDEVEMDGSTGVVTKIAATNVQQNSTTDGHRYTQMSA